MDIVSKVDGMSFTEVWYWAATLLMEWDFAEGQAPESLWALVEGGPDACKGTRIELEALIREHRRFI